MATKTLRLQIGEGLSDEQIVAALDEHIPELSEFLVDRLEYINVRATLDEFRLGEIERDGDRLILGYSYDWSAYYGCRDADAGDTEEESISVIYTGGCVVFEKEEIPPRFPNEEF